MSPPVCVNAKENGGEAAPYYLQNAKMRSTEFTEGRLLDLFFGMQNVIVEGFSDQKCLIAAAQLCAAEPQRVFLDLNAITFLTASGVGKIRQLVERVKSYD